VLIGAVRTLFLLFGRIRLDSRALHPHTRTHARVLIDAPGNGWACILGRFPVNSHSSGAKISGVFQSDPVVGGFRSQF
jgi:hypothetical protein